MAFTDFPNGLQDASDYLSATNSVNAQLTGSVADVGRLVVSAEFDYNLKEIICSLLAGRGLLLPNLQICISINLKELLGKYVGIIQDTLYDALSKLDQQFDKFMDHLKMDEVLGRINNVLAEVTNIANMINFCSSPIDPVQIPNLLETAMDSFLGAGRDIVDLIGQIIPEEIGGCLLDGEFQLGIWRSGIFKTLDDHWDVISTGAASISLMDSIVAEIDLVSNQIDDLVNRENDVAGSYDQGGSELAETPRITNEGMGVLYNSQDEGIQGATSTAAGLWGAYQQLGSYQVVDSDGVIYNNIFELFCDDDLLRVLRRTPNPTPEISEQEPVYNYCGEIIGYTKVVTQEDTDTSVGTVPGTIDQPGFDAGGLPTNPVNAADANAEAAGGGTVNTTISNTYNIDGAVLFADSEAEMLALNTSTGQMVYRNDTNITYVNNGGSTGTISDFNVVGSGSGGGGDTLGAFLSNVNIGTGTGLLTRSGDSEFYRAIAGTANQIAVANGTGASNNPTISIISNPTIPGSDSMVIPKGSTGDRVSTTNGALRYNNTTNQFEGYQGGAWFSFATGSGSVVDGSNVGGGGYEVYKQNNGGVLEFKTFAVSGAITMGVVSDVITVGESITGTTLGAGRDVFKQRNVNEFEFRALTPGNGIALTQSTTEIEIAVDGTGASGTVFTSNATLTEVLFNGVRMTPASNKTWFFTITAVANRSTISDATAIKIEGLIDNNSGTVTIVGTAGNKTVYNSTAGTSNYDLTLDIVGSEFRVQVNGDATHNVDWRVKFDFIEAP